MLGDVTVLVDVKILEHGFQVDSHNTDCVSVLLEDFLNVNTRVCLRLQVLSTGIKSVVNSLSSHSLQGVLVNALDSENFVDACCKVNIVEKHFGVLGLVLVAESLKFDIFEGEIQN